MRRFLLDVNVLFALMHSAHPHSAVAKKWIDDQEGVASLQICRVVQMAALRLLTNPNVLKADVVEPQIFWWAWDQLLADLRFVFVEEPEDLEHQWRKVTLNLVKGAVCETDVYLASFALSGGWELATFDRGFTRFPGLKLHLLA